MLKFKPNRLSALCLALLSVTLFTSMVFGYEEDRVSYLDSVSGSYLKSNSGEKDTMPVLTNMNSYSARGFETTLRLDSPAAITNSSARVNLSLRNSDLRQVLRMLADKAQINIVFDESVDGKLTLDLKNVKVNEAFMIIFKSSQLTYHMDGNTITVMTIEASKELAYTRRSMTVLPVKYVNANSVAKFLNENLFKSKIYGLSNQAIVTSNPRTNQIVIFGTQEDVTAIKRVLPILDTKPMVNTFIVNHTTPKEMAKLLCDTLFSVDNDSDDDDDDDDDDEEDDKISMGGGTLACRDNFGKDQEISDDKNSNQTSEQGLMAFEAAPLTIMYFSDLGKISTYGGSVEQVEIIRDFIKAHDKKQLMAYLELSVIELNESGSKTFDNSWNLWTPFISLGFSPSAGFNIGSNNSPFFLWGHEYTTAQRVLTKDSNGNVTENEDMSYIQRTNNHALTYTLNYIIENGNGRVLTNPKVMITSGKKATLDMTSDYVKSVTSQILEGSSTITSGTQRQYEIGDDEGLLIEIVPFISPDGYVSMNITPEFSTIKQQAADYTLLQRRDLELKNVRIKDGETLVLAGLIKENESQSVRKMPVLSDLPFIGTFFRSSENTKSREELVIVITPHIIKDNDSDADSNIYDL